MLLRKTNRFWKISLAAISLISKIILYLAVVLALLSLAGCNYTAQKETQPQKGDSNKHTSEPTHTEDDKNILESEAIAETYHDIFMDAVESRTLGELEVMRSIITRLGNHGYVAVDSENQIDMAGSEQVIKFCAQVEVKEVAELTIIQVSNLGGFTKYDFKTEKGKVDIVRGYYEYENEYLKNMSRVKYTADLWQYTEEGYLLFEGSHFSDVYYVLALSNMPERTALRVQPLDKKCRELNRQYIQPIGYKNNNMFLVDWNESDFGNLNFYDFYDVFYPLMYNQPVPYTANDNLGDEAIYRIAKDEFEDVIMLYFNIDSRTLQSKTVYFPEDKVYEYRPRGFYEAEYPDIPYPEVVGYEENSDGTITLTVNAVYPDENTSKAFVHEVVIRPLTESSLQYVSNRMLSSEDNYEAWWHTDRLTAKEWEEVLWFLPQESNPLLTEDEKRELENLALSAAGQVTEVYKNVEIEDGPSFASNIKDFTIEQCKEVVMLLGKAGFVSVTEETNMENYKDVEEFYSVYTAKQDAMVTIFNVNYDGLIIMD